MKYQIDQSGRLSAAGRFGRKLVGYVHQKNHYQHQSSKNLDLNINFPEIAHFSISFSHKTVISKNNIADKKFAVNPTNSIIFFGKAIVNPTKAERKKAADILIAKPENALSQGFVRNLCMILRLYQKDVALVA